MSGGIQLGLVSVTFRQVSAERVVALASEAGLAAVEWGGDVHVPHGDLATAGRVRRLCESAGLHAYAYGSYYFAGAKADGPSFGAVLATATALGAPAVRVWAGCVGSAAADGSMRDAVRDDLARACDLAGERDVRIDMEFHDCTLTDTAASAVALVDAVRRPNLRSYWQPKHGFTVEQNLADLALIGPRLGNMHVFHWWPDLRTRLPLVDGIDRWRAYLAAAAADGVARVAALEFVREDGEAQLVADAKVLKSLLKRPDAS